MTAKKGKTMFASRGRSDAEQNAAETENAAAEKETASGADGYASRIIKAAQLCYGGENWLRALAEDLEAMARGARGGALGRAGVRGGMIPRTGMYAGAGANGYGAGMYVPPYGYMYGSCIPPFEGGREIGAYRSAPLPYAPAGERSGGSGGAGKSRDTEREAELLSRAAPSFSYDEAMKNEVFSSALDEGLSVLEAYAKMLEMPKNAPRDPIAQNAQTAQRGTGEASADPSKLDTADFMKYISRIRNV